MKEPQLVAECCLAMRKAAQIPVTIKTRLGVDDLDTYEFAKEFITITSKYADLNHYIMHARKAYLKVSYSSGKLSVDSVIIGSKS